MRKKLVMVSLTIIAALGMLIAQATTVGACPPFLVHQPKLPKSLRSE